MARGTSGVMLKIAALEQSLREAGGFEVYNWVFLRPSKTFEQFINTPLPALNGKTLIEMITPTPQTVRQMRIDFDIGNLSGILVPIQRALAIRSADGELELSPEAVIKMYPAGIAPAAAAAGPAAVQQPRAQSPAAPAAAPPRAPIPAAAVGAAMPPGAAQMGSPQRPVPEAPAVAPSPVPVGPAAVQQPRAQGPAAAVAAAPVRPGSPIPAAAPARVNRKALFDELSLELQKLPLEGRVNTMLNMPLVHLGNRTLRDMGISGQDVGGWINSGGSLFAIGIANRAADTAEALAAAPPRRAASPGGRAPSPAVAGPAAGGFPGPARPGLDKEAFKQELAGFLTLLGNQPGRVRAIRDQRFTALGSRTPIEVGIGGKAIADWLQRRQAVVAIQDLDRFVDQVAAVVSPVAPARAASPDAVRRSPSPAAQQPRAQGPAAAVAVAPVRPGSPIPAAAPAIVYQWGLFDELSRKLKSLKPGGRVNTMLNMPLVELGNRTLKDMGISSKDVDGWINRGGSLLAIVNRAAEAAARDDVADLLKTMHRIKKREGFGKTAEIHDLTFRGRPLQEALGDQFDVPRWLQASADREPGIEGRLKRVLAAPSPAAAAAAVRHRSPSPVAAQVDVRRAPTPPPTPPDPQQRRGWGSWLWGRQ